MDLLDSNLEQEVLRPEGATMLPSIDGHLWPEFHWEAWDSS